MSHVVTAELVIVTDESGAQHHVYKGAPLPAFVKGDQLKRLQELEFVGDAPEAHSGDESKTTSRSSRTSK